MANSYIIIDFTAMPSENASISFNEAKNGLVLNEIFKLARLANFQTEIPLQNSGKYEMRIPNLSGTDNLGISYTPIGGTPVRQPLSSVPVMDQPDGSYVYTVFSEESVIFYDLTTLEDIYWPGGSFENVGNYYTDFISRKYKSAFELDYNGSSLFLVEETNGVPGSGLGSVKITANYTNAFFSAGTYPFATITIFNQVFENSVSPESLEFLVESNSIEAVSKTIEIVSDTNWQVTSFPAWLSFNQLSGNGNGSLSVNPINYSDMPTGQYDFPVIIEIEAHQFTVNVVLKIYNTILSPYPKNEIAFTLDEKYFIIQGDRENTYFQFDSTITIHKFFSNETLTYQVPQKALLFKGKSKINVGLFIHRLMDNFSTINSNLNQYSYAELSVYCEEKLFEDDTIITKIRLPEIKFVAGLSIAFNSFGFLEYNKRPTRVTKKGFYFLNILIPDGNFELNTFKNGEVINTLNLPAMSSGPICYKVLFDEYMQGDLIEFVVNKAGFPNENPSKKSFHIFPEQNFSNVIVWENEFLLQSSLEFTHDHEIKNEIERQTSKTYNGFVEKTTNHHTSKEYELAINTGWLAKSDIDSVESLMMARKAYIKIDNKIVNLVPISKNLTNYDSNQQLFDYTVKFTINRTYNEETYTF